MDRVRYEQAIKLIEKLTKSELQECIREINTSSAQQIKIKTQGNKAILIENLLNHLKTTFLSNDCKKRNQLLDCILPNSGHNPNSNLKFKTSPFIIINGQLGPTRICTVVPEKKNVIHLNFRLDPSQVEVLKTRQEALIEFPNLCLIKVNKTNVDAVIIITLDLMKLSLKNRPGTVHPQDITELCKKDSSCENKIEFHYENTSKDYILMLYLVKKVTVEEIVNRIKNGKYISKEIVLEKIKKSRQDSEVVATSSVVSLKDTLSHSRINLPCRSIQCNHLQCFDVYSYFKMNEQTPTWTCPICHKILDSWEEIVVDGFFNDILANTPVEQECVTIEADGSWAKSKRSHKNNSSEGDSGSSPGSDSSNLSNSPNADSDNSDENDSDDESDDNDYKHAKNKNIKNNVTNNRIFKKSNSPIFIDLTQSSSDEEIDNDTGFNKTKVHNHINNSDNKCKSNNDNCNITKLFRKHLISNTPPKTSPVFPKLSNPNTTATKLLTTTASPSPTTATTVTPIESSGIIIPHNNQEPIKIKEKHSKLKLAINREITPGFVDTSPRGQEINVSKLLLEQIEKIKKKSKALTIGSKDFNPVAFLDKFHEKKNAEVESSQAPEYKVEYDRVKNVVSSRLEYFNRVFTCQTEKKNKLKLERRNAKRNVALQCIETIKKSHLFDTLITVIQIEDNVFSTEMEEVKYSSQAFLNAFHQKIIIGDQPKYTIVTLPQPKLNKVENKMDVDEPNQQIELDGQNDGQNEQIKKTKNKPAKPYDVRLVKELEFKRNPNLDKLFDSHKIRVDNFNIHDKECTVPQSKLWIDRIIAENPDKLPHVILQEFCLKFKIGQVHFIPNEAGEGRFNYTLKIDGREPVRTSVWFTDETDAKAYVAKKELTALLNLYEINEQEELLRVANDYKLKIGLIKLKDARKGLADAEKELKEKERNWTSWR
ncbi:6439_t:CDS:10 [Entrophospora sp. SA101]|nr:6439_t:CDS:10 [Entrophospora sp. SA101]